MNCNKPGLPRAMRTVLAAAGASVALALVGCGPAHDAGHTNSQAAAPAEAPPEKKAVLHVDLQDGFSDDAVEIRLGDETIYQRDAVSTDMRISRADAVQVALANGKPALTVRLPGRQIEASMSLEDLEAPIYIGVSVVDGAIRFKVSEQPFGYM